MRPASLVLTAALGVFLCATAAAQQAIGNPHGKLQEECAVCHSSETWVPAHVSAQFDHAKHGFALRGAHAQAACRSCHASLDFHGASGDCVSCHKDIHHGELGTNCATCHTPRNFLDRSMMVQAHQLTRFPLRGSHLSVDCEACHTPMPQGRLTFVNLPVQCVECHLQSYTATTNPPHASAGFPTNCETCHTPATWTGAGFNHTWFPVPHHAAQCSDCHAAASNYANFVCTICHTQAQTDPRHQGVRGYVWNSTNCYACHRNGRGG